MTSINKKNYFFQHLQSSDSNYEYKSNILMKATPVAIDFQKTGPTGR